MDAESDGLREGLREADGEIEGDKDGDNEADGLADGEIEGLIDGDKDGLVEPADGFRAIAHRYESTEELADTLAFFPDPAVAIVFSNTA